MFYDNIYLVLFIFGTPEFEIIHIFPSFDQFCIYKIFE